MTTNRHQMGRRQFLIFSSTAALATATVGPKLFAAEAAAPKRLAVGFAPFDADVAVGSASSVPAADGAFISRGARVTVQGARFSSNDPRARRAVDLLAHYSYVDGSERKSVPFRVWACSRQNECAGNPASFTVPVDETQKLVFTVETERGMPSGSRTNRREVFGSPTESAVLPVTLSLTSEQGSLKLARGFYVIVPMFDDESDPSWGYYTVAHTDNRWTLVDRDGNPAPFEHFVLRIDYASQS